MLKCLPYNYVELIEKYIEKLTERGDTDNTNNAIYGEKLTGKDSFIIASEDRHFTVTLYRDHDYVRFIDMDSRSVYTLTAHDDPLDITDMCELKSLLEYIERNMSITLHDWTFAFLDGRSIYNGKLLNIYHNGNHLLIEALNGNTYQLTADEINVFEDCVIESQLDGDCLTVTYRGESEIEDIDDVSKIYDSAYIYLQALLNVENLSSHMSVTEAIPLADITLDTFKDVSKFSLYGIRAELSTDQTSLKISLGDIWHVNALLTPTGVEALVKGKPSKTYRLEIVKRPYGTNWIDYPSIKQLVDTMALLAHVS